MRSWLIKMNSCSGTGRASTADSFTGIAPTPSVARAESIDVNQSLLLGAMLADGLLGGSTPTALAAAAEKVPTEITPTDARTQTTARK
jgi:hypothetical protein